MRRASRTIRGVGAIALLLAFAAGVVAAPRKTATERKEPEKTSANPGEAPPSWVADELRILRSEVESLRQQPAASVESDLAALRADVSKLASAQEELERRVGGAPLTTGRAPEPGARISATGAAVLFGLGAALGWIGSQLSHRWRDRRQRIRL